MPEASPGFQVLHPHEPGYPDTFERLSRPPRPLYVRGTLPDLGKAIAVVGSRNATPYGLRSARDLARSLATRGIVVVSGMAQGIDGAAHLGALDAGGLTVAVLGSGIDVPFPAAHRALYRRILDHGAILSEYPAGTPPLPHHFPMRNRLVSGLCQAIVVVEATRKSGALITADAALDQGKEVFALPGPVGVPQSEGTNRLIAEGARPLLEWDEIGQEWGWMPEPTKAPLLLSTLEQKILEVLAPSGGDPQKMAQLLQWPVSTITASLVLLELKSLVHAVGGGMYSKGACASHD